MSDDALGEEIGVDRRCGHDIDQRLLMVAHVKEDPQITELEPGVNHDDASIELALECDAGVDRKGGGADAPFGAVERKDPAAAPPLAALAASAGLNSARSPLTRARSSRGSNGRESRSSAPARRARIRSSLSSPGASRTIGRWRRPGCSRSFAMNW